MEAVYRELPDAAFAYLEKTLEKVGEKFFVKEPEVAAGKAAEERERSELLARRRLMREGLAE
eukprot:6293234-Lingulodinium_polyedra.AAC.1